MRNCIPDELFNLIPFEYGEEDVVPQGMSSIIQESVYRLPNVKDVTVEREIWHALCDFAERTGTLLEKSQVSSGNTLTISPAFGRFVRVVGASEIVSVSDVGVVTFRNPGENYAVYSVAPSYALGGSETPADAHLAPKWYLRRYQKEILDAAMISLYAIIGDETSARTAAAVYGNDIKRCSAGFITSGMRSRIEVGVEDVLETVRRRVQEKQDAR